MSPAQYSFQSAVRDDPFLRIDNVVKDFGAGAIAVNRVSLDIARGEIFALLGSSGCGKTTLLRMLAGFETPTSGSITLNGEDLVNLPPYQRPINMMFQNYALFPHLSVWDNIAFGLRREGLPKSETAERVESMLQLVHLSKLTSESHINFPAVSSKGWRLHAVWPRGPSYCYLMSHWEHWTKSCEKPHRLS
jgi:ABC-type Fe3+/spermidine/putrescine transport system ATPase subunit